MITVTVRSICEVYEGQLMNRSGLVAIRVSIPLVRSGPHAHYGNGGRTYEGSQKLAERSPTGCTGSAFRRAVGGAIHSKRGCTPTRIAPTLTASCADSSARQQVGEFSFVMTLDLHARPASTTRAEMGYRNSQTAHG